MLSDTFEIFSFAAARGCHGGLNGNDMCITSTFAGGFGGSSGSHSQEILNYFYLWYGQYKFDAILS